MTKHGRAVVVVDMQNDFCHPNGALYSEASEDVIPTVNEVITSVGGCPWFTMDTHEAGDPEFEQWGEHCIRGSWGHDFHDELRVPYPSKIVVKDTYDAFHDTRFDERLTDAGINELIICGTLANVCVQETASSAALNGYDVTVVEDAVGYIDEDQKQAALDHVEFLFGDVVTADEL